MSRIGKIPLKVPKEAKVKIESGMVHVEGPKGKIDLAIPSDIKIAQKDDELTVTRVNDSKQGRSNHGTIRSRLNNILIGVTKGHRKDLDIFGVGFRAAIQGTKVIFNVGFSHPVEFEVPKDVKVLVPTQTTISIEGADLVKVGLVASKMRMIKPAEPYKGKGIKYAGEVIRRKQGKSATKK